MISISAVCDRKAEPPTGGSAFLLFLRRWLGLSDIGDDSGVVVVQNGHRKLGIVVDQVRGREEVVVKPLPPSLRGLAGFAAATITGDGNLALILDIAGLQRAV